MKNETNDIVKALQKCSITVVQHKLAFAKLLSKAVLLNWSKTDYKTFDGMIKYELNDSNNEIYQLLYEYSCIQKFAWFNSKEQSAISELLGWTRFVLAIQFETEKLTVIEFVAKYKNIALYKLKKKEEKSDDCDRAYGFSLPYIHANKLDGILIQHGMTITNGRRHAVRDSVMSFLDSL